MYLFVYLFNLELRKGRNRGISSIYGFSPQMAEIANGRPGGSQELRAPSRSSAWVTGAKALVSFLHLVSGH